MNIFEQTKNLRILKIISATLQLQLWIYFFALFWSWRRASSARVTCKISASAAAGQCCHWRRLRSCLALPSFEVPSWQWAACNAPPLSLRLHCPSLHLSHNLPSGFCRLETSALAVLVLGAAIIIDFAQNCKELRKSSILILDADSRALFL